MKFLSTSIYYKHNFNYMISFVYTPYTDEKYFAKDISSDIIDSTSTISSFFAALVYIFMLVHKYC